MADKFTWSDGDLEVVELSLADDDSIGVVREGDELPDGISLAFCPTGPGGGIDNSCGSGGVPASFGSAALKFVSGHEKGTEGFKQDAESHMQKLAKERADVISAIKATKAAGSKQDLNKLRKRRAELNKAIEDAQKGKVSSESIKKPDEVITSKPDVDPTPKLTTPAAIAAHIDEAGVVKECCCVDDSVRPNASHKAHVEKLHAKVNNILTQQEEEAVSYYTGSGYRAVNAVARGEFDVETHGQSQIDYTMKRVLCMDSAIEKAPRLEKDIVVCRGMVSNRMAKLKTGDEFEDKGFVSTSVTSSVPDNFANTESKTDAVIMNIRVPKGSKGIYVGNNGMGMASEKEFILPRGSRFVVEGVKTLPNKGALGVRRVIQLRLQS